MSIFEVIQPLLLLLLLLMYIPKGILSSNYVIEDLVLPYSLRHGSWRTHRSVRDCQPPRYNNVTFELYKSHFVSDHKQPVVNVQQFTENIGTYWSEQVLGNIVKVNNPFKTLTFLEPMKAGGCEEKIRSSVIDTSKSKTCLVAMNGGMFNTTDGTCLGNIVINGEVVHDNGGIQNAHFGIKKDSSIFVGYLAPNIDLRDFKQLIGGVIWLVRNGENYVSEALKAECEDTQETGTLSAFASVTSARTAIGHDADGKIVLVQIDGKTWSRGINLEDFANLLIKFGVMNAINLDGGGSSTLVVNGTLVSHPSDTMVDNVTNIHYAVMRNITTIVCVHEYVCDPVDCNGRGICLHGTCKCEGFWSGASCEHVQCGTLNCSGHGVCSPAGCTCNKGYIGADCNEQCSLGTYGMSCQHSCRCANQATCDPIDGTCTCKPGYAGLLCDQECPYGFFGERCQQICYCEESCFCDHITGQCLSAESSMTTYRIAGMCLAQHIISERNLVPENIEQYRLWVITTVVLALVAASSIILNISIICINCTCILDGKNGTALKRKTRKNYARKSGIDQEKSYYFSKPKSFMSTHQKKSVEYLKGEPAGASCAISSSMSSSTDGLITSSLNNEERRGFVPSVQKDTTSNVNKS